MALLGRPEGRQLWLRQAIELYGAQVLKDMFGDGQYVTVEGHSDRWQELVKWYRSEAGPGVNDARQIDRQVLSNYAAYFRSLVEHGHLAISTAHNRLSSVNRIMVALRGDQYVKVPVRARRWVCSEPRFVNRCRRDKIANTYSEQLKRFAAVNI